MKGIHIKPLTKEDEKPFLSAMQSSKSFHHPWIFAPTTDEEFDDYLAKYSQDNYQSHLVCDKKDRIVGVINLNDIVLDDFQTATVKFFVVAEYAGKGYMSQGIKLIMQKAFEELGLHRLEANIQPKNFSSKSLVEKNGFKKEGFSPRFQKINGSWCDQERWAITYEDWKILKGLDHG